MAKVDLSRISLRPFKISDVDDFLLWAGDDRVTQNLRWKTCGSREEALEFIRDVCIPHPWRRSICLDDHSIGFISAFTDVENIASQRVLEKDLISGVLFFSHGVVNFLFSSEPRGASDAPGWCCATGTAGASFLVRFLVRVLAPVRDSGAACVVQADAPTGAGPLRTGEEVSLLLGITPPLRMELRLKFQDYLLYIHQ
ncbi:hypothetical protein RIF29_19532 [Crotalaria pallida]|uniref:N-acetyltransferase domain-containing protein n=1 Tax=Crotalaria pallida TaxID=3830 RepID=A0AAN9I6L1_CROPI